MGCASSAATGEKEKVQSDDERIPDNELAGAGSHENDSVLDVRSPHSAIFNGSTNDVFVFRDQASPVSCFEEMSSLWSCDRAGHVHDADKINIDVHEDFFNEFEDNFDETEDFNFAGYK